MAHNLYAPALAALRKQLAQLDDQRQKVLHAINAIEALPSPPDEQSAPVQEHQQVHDTREITDAPSYPKATRMVLEEKGEALHMDDLARSFRGRGWYPDKDFIKNRSHRASLAGSLDRRVRKGETFYKPAEATYALLEWRKNGDGHSKTPTPDSADAGAHSNEGR